MLQKIAILVIGTFISIAVFQIFFSSDEVHNTSHDTGVEHTHEGEETAHTHEYGFGMTENWGLFQRDDWHFFIPNELVLSDETTAEADFIFESNSSHLRLATFHNLPGHLQTEERPQLNCTFNTASSTFVSLDNTPACEDVEYEQIENVLYYQYVDQDANNTVLFSGAYVDQRHYIFSTVITPEQPSNEVIKREKLHLINLSEILAQNVE